MRHLTHYRGLVTDRRGPGSSPLNGYTSPSRMA